MSEFTIVEWRKLGEALERFEVASPETIEGQEGTFIAPLTLDDALAVFEGASLTYDRYQECDNPECDEGRIWEYQDNSTADQWYDCPSCGGSGLQPNQARLEAARNVDGGMLVDMVAAVRAFDKEKTDE
jgi:hypothetical protein